jgi:hypothetical protein
MNNKEKIILIIVIFTIIIIIYNNYNSDITIKEHLGSTKPTPKPTPKPSPKPAPTPRPSPVTITKPTPTPAPRPSPVTITKPTPTPTPRPSPVTITKPTPKPSPTPTPTPIPTLTATTQTGVLNVAPRAPPSPKCPPQAQCFTGDFIVQEDGKLTKKDNKLIYDINGNIDVYDYLYQANGSLQRKNTASGNKFTYTADGTLNTQDFSYLPSRTIKFDNFMFDKDKNVTRLDNSFKYNSDGTITKDNLTITKDDNVITSEFNYVLNDSINFDNFTYNVASKNISRKDNKFKYEYDTGKITKDDITINNDGSLSNNRLNFVPNNNLTFDNYIYGADGNLTTKNNTFNVTNNKLNFGNFSYDSTTGNVVNDKEQFMYKSDNSIKSKGIIIDSSGVVNFNNLTYDNLTGNLTSTDPKKQFSYSADGSISVDKLNYIPGNSLDFDGFIFNNNGLSNNTRNFNYNSDGSIKINNITQSIDGIAFDKYIYDENNNLTRTDNNFIYDNNGNISSNNITINNDNSLNFDKYNYDGTNKNLTRTDNNFSFDKNKNIIYNETSISPNNELKFGNFVYDEAKNLTREDNNFRYDNTGNINKDNINLDNKGTLTFNNLMYSTDGSLKEISNAFNYSNGNLAFDGFIYQENKEIINTDKQFSYKPDGTIRTKGLIVEPNGTLNFNDLIYNNATGSLTNKNNTFSFDNNGLVKSGSTTVDSEGNIKTNLFKYTPTDISFNKFTYDIRNNNLKSSDNSINYDSNNNITAKNVSIKSDGSLVTPEFNMAADKTINFDKYVYDNTQKKLTRTDNTFVYDENGNISKDNNTIDSNGKLTFSNLTYDIDGSLKENSNAFNYSNGNLDFGGFIYQENNEIVNIDKQFSYKPDGTIRTKGLIVEPNGTLNFNNLIYNNATGSLTNKNNSFSFDNNGLVKSGSTTVDSEGNIKTNLFKYTPTDISFNKFTYDIRNNNLKSSDNSINYDSNNNITTKNVKINSDGSLIAPEFNMTADKTINFDKYVYDNTQKKLTRTDNTFVYDENGNISKDNNTIDSNGKLTFSNLTYDIDGSLKENSNKFNYSNGNLNFDGYVYQENKNLTNSEKSFSYGPDGTIKTKGLIVEPNGTLNFNNLIYNNATGTLTNKNNTFSFDNNGLVKSGSTTVDSEGKIQTNSFKYTPTDISFNKFTYDIRNNNLKSSDNSINYDSNNNITAKNVKINSDGSLVAPEFNMTADKTINFDKYVYDNTQKKLTRTDNTFVYDVNGNVSKNNNTIDSNGKLTFSNLTYDIDGTLKENSNKFNYSNGNLAFDGYVYQENKNLVNSEKSFSYGPDGTINSKGLTIKKDGSVTFNKLSYNNTSGDIVSEDPTKVFTYKKDGSIITDKINYKTSPTKQLGFDNFVFTNNNLTRTDNSFKYNSSGIVSTTDLTYNNTTRDLSFNNFVYDVTGKLRKIDNSLIYDNNGIVTNDFIYTSDNKITQLKNFNNFVFDESNKTLSNSNITISPTLLSTPDFKFNNTDLSFNNFNNLVYQPNNKLSNNIVTFNKDGSISNNNIGYNSTNRDISFNDFIYNGSTKILNNKLNTIIVDASSNITAYNYKVLNNTNLYDKLGNIISPLQLDASGNATITYSNKNWVLVNPVGNIIDSNLMYDEIQIQLQVDGLSNTPVFFLSLMKIYDQNDNLYNFDFTNFDVSMNLIYIISTHKFDTQYNIDYNTKPSYSYALYNPTTSIYTWAFMSTSRSIAIPGNYISFKFKSPIFISKIYISNITRPKFYQYPTNPIKPVIVLLKKNVVIKSYIIRNILPSTHPFFNILNGGAFDLPIV